MSEDDEKKMRGLGAPEPGYFSRVPHLMQNRESGSFWYAQFGHGPGAPVLVAGAGAAPGVATGLDAGLGTPALVGAGAGVSTEVAALTPI